MVRRPSESNGVTSEVAKINPILGTVSSIFAIIVGQIVGGIIGGVQAFFLTPLLLVMLIARAVENVGLGVIGMSIAVSIWVVLQVICVLTCRKSIYWSISLLALAIVASVLLVYLLL